MLRLQLIIPLMGCAVLLAACEPMEREAESAAAAPVSPAAVQTPTPEEAAAFVAEAEERRKKAGDLTLPTERGGRDGPEPVRYGDWEKKGIAIDF